MVLRLREILKVGLRGIEISVILEWLEEVIIIFI